jgi:5'(3')-deoxyribonucleotidase
MARIAVDIDSTLYDFCGLACRIMGQLAEERGDERLRNAAYSTSWTEWRTPIDLAGAEAWQEVVDICHKPAIIGDQVPYPGATEALWKLREAGHDLVYVSNRDPSTLKPTTDWLWRKGFPTLSAEVLCHTDDKLASIKDCQYLIDDRPKTLVEFLRMHTFQRCDRYGNYAKAFGLVTPYNRGLTDVPGIYLAPNWDLLSRYLWTKIGHPA